MGRPESIEQLRVALVGYRERDGGERVARVDLIDVNGLVPLASLTAADALVLADHLREVAGWAAATGPGS